MAKDTIVTVADKLRMAAEAGVRLPHYTNTDNPIDFPKDISMLKHTKGNLLDLAEAGEFDIIVQGCNCFNTMGGGIAREIRERYPHVAKVDMMTNKGDYMKLGTWTYENVIVKNGTVTFDIINAYTQYDMSTGEDVFEYQAFDLIIQKLIHLHGEKRIGLPYIGMGLAGGDKETILDMIEEFAFDVSQKGGSVTLVEFSLT
jgi:O-acetyl-ADP-ribose deacetylase (regulator of RNase III)